MIDEVLTVASQAARLCGLAEDAGIPLDWRLGMIVFGSWLFTEASRRLGCKGACAGWGAARAAWAWATAERPLGEGEQALVDCLADGVIDDSRSREWLTSRDGKVIADGNCVLIGDEYANGSLSRACLRKVRSLVREKLAEHNAAKEELKREAVQAKLAALKRQAALARQAAGDLTMNGYPLPARNTRS